MTQRAGFTILEFMVLALIIAGVIYALIPRMDSTIRWGHETAVKTIASSLHETIRFITLQRKTRGETGAAENYVLIGNQTLDLNEQGFPWGTRKTAGDHLLRVQDCIDLWQTLLGPQSPTVAPDGTSDYQVQVEGTPAHCLYRYQRGGDLWIRYAPHTGEVTFDDQF